MAFPGEFEAVTATEEQRAMASADRAPEFLRLKIRDELFDNGFLDGETLEESIIYSGEEFDEVYAAKSMGLEDPRRWAGILVSGADSVKSLPSFVHRKLVFAEGERLEAEGGRLDAEIAAGRAEGERLDAEIAAGRAKGEQLDRILEQYDEIRRELGGN